MRETFRYTIVAGLLTLALFVSPFDFISTAQSSVDQEASEIASALDNNQNRVLDDSEILNAIQLWILGAALPDGEIISDESILSLVQLWITGESIRPPLMGDDEVATTPTCTKTTDDGEFRFQVAETGTFLSKWRSPDSALAVDTEGNIYVAGDQQISIWDNGNFVGLEFFSGIIKYDANGTRLAKWDTKGSGDGKFRRAEDIAVDSNGNIFIADQDLSGIQKFDANGKFLTKWGSQGTGDGQFWGFPGGVAVDSAGNVYATDGSLNRIQKFDNNGKFLAKWHTSWQSTPGGDISRVDPMGIAVDSFGNVFITDTFNGLIQKYDANGTVLATWGGSGSGPARFKRPTSLALSGNNVYVFDKGNYRIQRFDHFGKLLATWGGAGDGDGQFERNVSLGVDHGMSGGVAVDDIGNVYVLDSRSRRVQKFCGGI